MLINEKNTYPIRHGSEQRSFPPSAQTASPSPCPECWTGNRRHSPANQSCRRILQQQQQQQQTGWMLTEMMVKDVITFSCPIRTTPIAPWAAHCSLAPTNKRPRLWLSDGALVHHKPRRVNRGKWKRKWRMGGREAGSTTWTGTDQNLRQFDLCWAGGAFVQHLSKGEDRGTGEEYGRYPWPPEGKLILKAKQRQQLQK